MNQEIKFKKIYSEIQNRLKDSILSLWATGDAQFQKYLSELFEEEKLLAEPVFQNTFPWTPAKESFGDLTNLFDTNFINKLDKIKGEYEFPKNRNPYVHQIKSWKVLLNEKKSIAVTTGTGSGKTECFMLPVLQDLYENCQNEHGVRAIFLYPLNALIGSQKKRMDAWVKALDGLTYAVYNGNTDEDSTPTNRNKYKPELISRTQIRENPPQILFTNPSMLEYILVRDKDVPLLENSKGKLRWILLDEAHTLVGSAASEMALLIRRVVDAFDVDIKDLRFAITSATVGSGEESEKSLKDFMSNLCGIEKHQIEVITGQREFKTLPDNFKVDNKNELELLRKKAYNSNAITLTEITENLITKKSSQFEKLEIVDTIVEIKYNDISILPLRAHLFSRGIGGVYVCSNPNCDKHKNFEAKSLLGTMTTYAEKNCSSCNFPMFELVACRSCGNELLKAEKKLERNGSEILSLSTSINQDNFIVDDIDNDENDKVNSITQSFFFTKRNTNKRYVPQTLEFGIDSNGKINRNQDVFIEADRDDECVCPYCSNNLVNPLHFRISSSFMNRILSDIFLENTPDASPNITTEMLWNGHKYISFTDSRQGTAKISALINIDNENNWVRSQVFHLLWKEHLGCAQNNPNEALLNILIQSLENATNAVQKRGIQEQIDKLMPKKEINARLSWQDFYNHLNHKSELKTLFKNNNPREDNFINLEKYSRALLFDNFARRLPRERSLENLGMVRLVYPDLDNAQLPRIAEQNNITIEEWKNLLKIGLDYVIRNQFYYVLDYSIYPYSSSILKSFQIHNSDSNITNAKKWPTFKANEARPNRLSLLLCAGLGYYSLTEITNEIEQGINELLHEIWKAIIANVLEFDNTGYKLNLEQKSRLQIPEKLWLCPVKKRLIDAQFKGFSPWITGSFTEDNIRHFEIKQSQPYTFPKFNFPFNRNDQNELDILTTKDWISTNSGEWKQNGLWNDIHEKIILNRPLYLSGEHSAQQNEKRLKQLEDKFEKAEINILNCSTTMEMGVDIGGISTVVMNNVPPGPSNYLQRAGRAGRRKESKSIAFTVCAPNPVGLNAFNTPTWALTHKIAPPFISFNSTQVVERHINAFFLGKFVQTDAVRGIRVTDKIESFFFDELEPIAVKFISWLMGNQVMLFSNQVENLVRNTNFENNNFTYILNKVFSNFNQLLNKSKSKKEGFESKLKQLEEEFGTNSPAFKAVNIQYIQFLKKNALTFLAQEGFLPTAGLPTGIVEFDTTNIDSLNNNNNNSRKKENPSYFITRALTEFAPGNNIVIDGMNYHSSGIILDDNRGNQSSKEIIQLCNSCGYQRIVEVSAGQTIATVCPHCQNQNFRGLISDNDGNRGIFTEMIQPAGFAVDIYQTPNRKISESSNIQYVDPLLINVKPWEQNSNTIYDIRESEENGEILYYNVGNGNGFHVCLHCGKTGLSLQELNDHRRLRGGQDDNGGAACLGNYLATAIRPNVILGGRFKTDFCEIRIREKGAYSRNETLLYSLGSVFVKELASYLAIEHGELDFGIKRYDTYSTIFIFDTTKGGAGYATQFFLYADEIFKQSKIKLECNCQNACTKCLIDRKTQWHINLLDRNIALVWLNSISNYTISDDVTNSYPSAKRMLGSIKQELIKLNYVSKIKEAWLIVSPILQNWDLDSILFLENLKSKAVVNIVLTEAPIIANSQDIMTLIQLSAWSKLWIQKGVDNEVLTTISFVQLQDDTNNQYIVNDTVNLDLDKNWGESSNGELFKVNIPIIPILQSFQLDKLLNTSNVFEAVLDTNSIVNSVNLADEVLIKLENKVDLGAKMKDKKFNVFYSDRYLKTPFGCLLMLQFLNRLQTKLGFEIDNFTFNGQDFYNERTPQKLFHEFKDRESRDSYLKSFSYELDASIVNVVYNSIPHYRYFEFSNDEIKIIIRPDAGVEHGWKLKDNNLKVEDINNLDTHFDILKMNNHPILYTISVVKIYSPTPQKRIH